MRHWITQPVTEPSPSPSPTNTSPGTAQDLGSFACDDLTMGGTVGRSPRRLLQGHLGWLHRSDPPSPGHQVTVTSSTGTGTPGYDLYSAGNLATPVATNTTAVTLGNNQTGDYYINGYNPGGGAFTYTLTLENLPLV